ncbi:OmpA family protein [Acidipila rosea]|uniref:Outer membrane protein OmpA-like peptidoglycan-associated protein n=1 Tax=Acidipila rosea TaxID=768535 RepID=A0A4R1L789_9BACT|nr:OmpA family protein [Acidipila rosea]MBW4043781.1 OmpA family protein [Acidobacteriota bacterium]TCK74082.1 outer membrane protein OmpA-like peptidoglycan-associated protein [Acidipila rosea]
MHSSSLHSLGRILLVGGIVGLSASSLIGQTPSSKPAAPSGPNPSRIDIFAGYSYLAPHGTVTTNNTNVPGGVFSDRYASINAGAIGSVAYYFNKYVGGQIEYANHPDGNNDGAQTAQGGIIFRYPVTGMTPFIHALAGGVRLGGPNAEPYAAHGYTWGPALTVGGGLDYDLPFFNHHLGLRLFQADYEYFHVNYGPQPYTGGRANVESARLSTGLVYHMGSIVPPPPVQYSCAVNPTTVFPGDPVTVTGTATNLNPKKPATYSWSGQGVTVKGDSNSGTIDTSSLQPGSYTVTGHVTEGAKPGQSADCTSNFTVKQFEPPTVSCSASPTDLKPGDSATITATGVSPQNRPLTYSYSASAGSVSGTGNSATLTTTGAPSGSITVTCNVSDDKGQTASSTTTVNVQAPPPPPAPKVQTLCSINFERDKRRPTRVDNEAKACLDDVALNAQRQSDASVVVVGNSGPSEKNGSKLAAQRAVNAKEYLVKEKGIDPSRITARTGNQGSKEVQDYLVPSGANFDNDVQGTTAVDEAAMKAQPRKAAHHHKHKKSAAAKK